MMKTNSHVVDRHSCEILRMKKVYTRAVTRRRKTSVIDLIDRITIEYAVDSYYTFTILLRYVDDLKALETK